MRPLLQTKVWKFLMSQIGNHAFMQKFVELLNSASPKLAVELIAPDAVSIRSLPAGSIRGRRDIWRFWLL